MPMIPIVGQLSDQFGSKWFLLSGAVLFLLGSILAGASQSMDQLIIFRGVQGLGAGIGMALLATILAALFPPAQPAKAGSPLGPGFCISNLHRPRFCVSLGDTAPLFGPPLTHAAH